MTHTHPDATLVIASVATERGTTIAAMRSELLTTSLSVARREAAYRAFAETDATSEEVGAILDRHHSTVQRWAIQHQRQHELPRPGRYRAGSRRSDWTPDEDRLLAAIWANAEVAIFDAVAATLPHRSHKACNNRANALGLIRPRRSRPTPSLDSRCDFDRASDEDRRSKDQIACDRLLVRCLQHHWDLAPAALRKRFAAAMERAA